LEDALVATGFPYDRWVNPDDNLREYRAFMKCTRGVRRCGSAALDLAMTADGTYAAFWEQRLNAWDMAAGALLVQLAGGRLSDYDGSPGEPRSGRIVATNARLHDCVLETLQSARESETPRA
jgi:myo-inositol-1(or 4)-monophosphatase